MGGQGRLAGARQRMNISCFLKREALGLSPNNVTCSILLKGVQKGMQEAVAVICRVHVIRQFVRSTGA